ncbi:hypothetical protein Z517_09096 [Fonsecaea pedrosoi CBS 271.37]|uniref:Uncharacterized protein n=1 Tax=Fonsecaea pedrosoi CBS 271.37 TaxID=1442368 RepID=A0A0D2EQT5_9EURO|nr:uncharacterized protein Z517_09096 [Fonsecaea pedrosoi CBS 271.37]KIW76652.1 hypothetical protein Z517_09096 [Fonsecaea pedrosoi CBS 271.37]
MSVGHARRTTDERMRLGNSLSDNLSLLRIASHPDRIPAAAESTLDAHARQTPLQRKRTADGAIKHQHSSRISDQRDELRLHSDYKRTSDVKMKMDLDVLRRRIALIEAQEQGNTQHRSVSKRARGQQQQLAGRGQRQQQIGDRQDAETKNNLTDWKEAIIR